jgi:renalase
VLADAGCQVQLFDKSRGVGGRLSTRRAGWTTADGAECVARFDHGALGFSAQASGFVRLVEQAADAGVLARWAPRIALGSHVPLDGPSLWVPTPDMPALCRWLLAGLPVQVNCTIDALRRGEDGWTLESGGAVVGEGFQCVVVAIPPRQAAALVQPHRPDWAQRALALPMLPAWALMGITLDEEGQDGWELAWPRSGPLATVVRNDAKPGRERTPGLAHWVVHATAEWSQTHLESPAAEVQAGLQAALQAWLRRPLLWQHVAVHRWRYATLARASASPVPGGARCWWDAASGLGTCGDALGGAGVEGAWSSGRALAGLLIDDPLAPPGHGPMAGSSVRGVA